jgi:hypothetical protein
MSKDLTIGEAAKAAGLSIDAVRFYERQGIMAPPPRLAGGRCPQSAERVGPGQGGGATCAFARRHVIIQPRCPPFDLAQRPAPAAK